MHKMLALLVRLVYNMCVSKKETKEYPVKVGDLIKCGDEFATILAITKQPDSDTFWLDCLWENGEEEGIDSDEVEAVNESH